MLLFDCFWTTEKGFLHPLYDVPYWFWCRYNIEWRWTSATFFEITYPQSWTGKFPFNICTFLVQEQNFFFSLTSQHMQHVYYNCLLLLTDINWYEWFIIAINKFNSTTILITEYVPNINIPQNLVNIFIPSNSKLSKSTNPNTAQNKVWVVSNKLQQKNNNKEKRIESKGVKLLAAIFFYFANRLHTMQALWSADAFWLCE